MKTPGTRHRVLFVCLGNICRSPTAEAVFRNLVAQSSKSQHHRAHHFTIDSAGTGGWHIGAPPDPRACNAAAKRGLDLSNLRARQVTAADLTNFHHLIAMDRANYATLTQLAGARYRHKIHLFLAFSPHLGQDEVPDPYYGDAAGYDEVLSLIEQASVGLFEHLLRQSAKEGA